MTETNFTLPRSPQSASKLLQLPNELITKILRYALKSPDPSQTLQACRTEDNDGSRLVPVDLSLSSQASRVCQTLLCLDTEILYRENTLLIAFTPLRGKAGQWCFVLDQIVELPQWDEDALVIQPRKDEFVRKIGWSHEYEMNNPRHHRALISQFRFIKFSFREKIPFTAGMLLRWFRSLSVPRDFETTVELDNNLDDATIEAYLETVAGWWRCKIATFDGTLEFLPQDIVRRVQGDSAIRSVADQLIRFVVITRNWFWPYRIPHWINSLSRREYYNFRRAQCTNNSVDFLKAMRPYVNSVLDNMSEDDLQTHIKSILIGERYTIHHVAYQKRVFPETRTDCQCNTVWTKQHSTGRSLSKHSKTCGSITHFLSRNSTVQCKRRICMSLRI